MSRRVYTVLLPKDITENHRPHVRHGAALPISANQVAGSQIFDSRILPLRNLPASRYWLNALSPSPLVG
jgi:hypothetical protein